MAIAFKFKVQHEHVGYVADFCRICRGIKPFALIGHSEQFMLFGTIPMGEKRYITSAALCTECGIKSGTSPEKYSTAINCKQKDIPEDLPSKTFPDLEQIYASRLQIENQINTGEGHPKHLRTFLLEEPFLLLAPRIQEGLADRTAVPVFLLCLAMISTYIMTNNNKGISLTSITLSAFSIFIALCAVHAFWVTQTNRRFMHKHIYPLISKCLKPLKPNTEEIKTVLSALLKKNSSATKHIQLEQLMKFLER